MKQVSPVTPTKEHLSNEVRWFVHAKGFSLASCVGLAFDEMENYTSSSIGILYLDPDAKPTAYLWGLLTRPPRRSFLGVVWFSDSARGADEQHWVFEVHGQKYLELARRIAGELASLFHVDISVRLQSAQTVQEIYVSDFCAT
jgi:hypothetical protein